MANGERKIPINKEAAKILRKQRKAFIKRFGREPGEGDPVFFDPSAPGPDPVPFDGDKMRRDVLAAMEHAGLPPHIIFAYAKTGLILAEDLRDTYEPEVVAEYDAAIREYFDLEAEKKGG